MCIHMYICRLKAEKVELYIVGQFGRYNVLDVYSQLFQCKKVVYSRFLDFF